MTKYEWETELKRNIHSLPADEIKRVLEYYGELFDDMAERGKSETEIINEFGNPFDVANKILSDCDGDPEQSSVVSAEAATGANNAAEQKSRPDAQPKPEVAKQQTDVPDERAQQSGAPQNVPPQNVPPQNVAAQNASVSPQNAASGRRADLARIALFVLFNVFTGGVVFIIIGVVWIVLAALTLSGAALVLGGGVAAVSSFAVMSTGHAGAGAAQLGISFAAAGVGILLAVGCVKLAALYGKLNKLIFGGIKNLLTVKAV